MATHPGTTWLQRHWDQLRDYNNQWVAASESGVVANSTRFDDVLDDVRAQSGSGAAVVLAFVTFDVVQ